MARHLIKSNNVLIRGFEPGALFIEGDKITGVFVGTQETHPADVEVHDFGDLHIVPGLVDAHVHINEPGRTLWEGFETATLAAAQGGVTTLVDMPLNCTPVTTTRHALEQKISASDGQLTVDVGFWGGVVPGNEEELTGLAQDGVLGAKAFLCHSGIDDFPKVEKSDLLKAMPKLAQAGIPLLAHAELELAIESLSGPPHKYASYLASRPSSWEDAAIALLIELSRQTQCPVHIVHLSSANALHMIREAKSDKVPITVETCPHYLCLTSEEVPDADTTYKCAPPIRPDANRRALWGGVADGTIDAIVSDHSPCVPGLKKLEEGNFMEAWGGIASLSLGLPAVYTAARHFDVSLARIATLMSQGPAKIAGLDDRKGTFQVGHDADLCIFDPVAEHIPTQDNVLFRNKISPYFGRTLKGKIVETWLRGNPIDLQARQPQGKTLLGRGHAKE